MTTYTWQNGVSADWSNAADWTPNGVPGSNDTAVIGLTSGGVTTAPWTVTVTNETAGMVLFDPLGPAGTLAVSGLLDVSGDVSLDSGTVDLQPAATLATAGTLTLGLAGDPGSFAVVTMTDGLIAAASLGVFDGSTLNMGGGAVALGNASAVAGTLAVGTDAVFDGDTGTIDASVVNDGTMVVLAVLVGEAAGALTISGTLTDNAGITVAAGAALAVYGDLNDYALVVLDADSALAVAGNVTLSTYATLQIGAGDAVSVAGTLNIQGTLSAPAGAYELAVGGALEVIGDGTFAVTDAAVSAGQFQFAGTVSVDGGSLTQTGSTADTIDAGTVDLSDGVTWTASQFVLGDDPSLGDESTATLDLAASGGMGDTLTVAGGLTLGEAIGVQGDLNFFDGANGVLDVAAGSRVSASGLDLASDPLTSTVSVDAGGAVVIGAAAAVAGAVAVGSGATLAASDGMIQANVVLNGVLAEQPGDGGAGLLDITGSLTGQGAIRVTDVSFVSEFGSQQLGGTVELADGAGFAGSITLDSGSALVLDGTGTPTGRISAAYFPQSSPFAFGAATVDLKALAYEAFNVPLYNAATGLLTVGGVTLDVGLGQSSGDFTTQNEGGGTDLLIAPTPCYTAGTGIATAHGTVPVEALRPGDAVLTPQGARPVRWVGRFAVDLDRHPAPAQVAPIRIRAHAMAENVPARDLLLSPDHAVLIGGVLMQAQSLVNGATILREPPRGRVTYVHVELDRHAILFAEGLPAESYLDTGNRAAFACEPGVRPLFPDLSARTWAADACAPLVLDGPALAAAHAMLLRRAHDLGHRLTDDPALTVFADGVALPLRRDGKLAWRARLPAGTASVRLRSRGFVPNDLGADDRRRLGIAVAALFLAGRALHPAGEGWHAAEPGWRWTDGDAVLALPRTRRPAWLRIAAVDAGARYWTAPANFLYARPTQRDAKATP